jgi:hypothetical protein
MKWRSIKVHDLYIDGNVNGDMGLTFARIDGALPFIRMPLSMALDIDKCGLVKIYNPLQACEKLR